MRDNTSGDVTITCRASDARMLPDAALRLIATYSGPLLPDRNGIVTMVLPAERWAEILTAAEAVTAPA
jgi:hypothetical protein